MAVEWCQRNSFLNDFLLDIEQIGLQHGSCFRPFIFDTMGGERGKVRGRERERDKREGEREKT